MLGFSEDPHNLPSAPEIVNVASVTVKLNDINQKAQDFAISFEEVKGHKYNNLGGYADQINAWYVELYGKIQVTDVQVAIGSRIGCKENGLG